MGEKQFSSTSSPWRCDHSRTGKTTPADGACASGDEYSGLDFLRLASDAHVRQLQRALRSTGGGADSAARGTSSVALGDDETAVAQRVIESGCSVASQAA